jgi:uncharacterized UBP type Zn finger protein
VNSLTECDGVACSPSASRCGILDVFDFCVERRFFCKACESDSWSVGVCGSMPLVWNGFDAIETLFVVVEDVDGFMIFGIWRIK